MTGTTIYHLHFKSGSDHYFGSIAAIYDLFKADALGVSRQRLYDFGITPDHPYDNKTCTIRKGESRRKKGNRKLPKTV
jgi:hypothetical protein